MKYLRRAAFCLLTGILLLYLSAAALAASGDSVLTAIGHSDTDTVALSGSDRHVTLTVPYDYAGTAVDLVNGLSIAYDETLYKSVVAQPRSPGTAAVCAPGAAAGDTDYTAVDVSFNAVGDADGAEKSVTTYYVRAERAEAVPAAFSGVIGLAVESGDTLPLLPSTFASNYEQNDGKALGAIVIRGGNLVAGTLAYTDGDTFGSEIMTDGSGAFAGKLTFTAASPGEVSYYIDAYEKNTGDYVGTAVLTISVYARPTAAALTASVCAGAELSYSELGFPDCFDLRGGSLESLEITFSDTDCGKWYLGSSALTAGKANTVAADKVSKLSFRATAAGTAVFSWRAANAAGYSDFAAGTITVSGTTLTLSAYRAASKMTRGNTWTVSASDFGYTPSAVSLAYIKITAVPDVNDGYLCLSKSLAKSSDGTYPAISANAKLTAGAVLPFDYARYLSLVTKSSGAGASVSFKWTATADSDASSAAWADAVTYTVGFVTGGTVSYETGMNIPLTLDASDFSAEFEDETGDALSCVAFTLPAKTSGTLYYDYSLASKTGTAVKASAKYYTGASPNLSYVTFVPASDYTGKVAVAYIAYDKDGNSVSGTLYITVSNSAGGTFSYTVDKNDCLHFDAADFADAFLDATGKTLSHVRFKLPSSSCGKLYYDYASSSDYDSTVSASKKYCVTASLYLSYVAFVPCDDYTGTVSISFSAYDGDGDARSGELVIFVVDSPAGIVSYSPKVNGTARLDGGDFADEFISVSGSVLSYVVFTPPAQSVGTLYSGYVSEASKGTKVSASTKYYNGSEPDISDITFVPAEDYSGTVEVKYTVYTAGGTAYVGKLKFRVGEGSSGSVSYKTGYNTALTFRASDFVGKFYSNTGGLALSCVEFTLPSASYGKLYYNYTSSSDYDAAVSSDRKYYVSAYPYLSDIAFVPKSGYSGSFSIAYTGYAGDGTERSGRVTITVGGESGTVYYETTSLVAVTFGASDFEDAFEDETGGTLSYVKFTLPSSASGKLYYEYKSKDDYTSAVSASTKYYARTSRYLSRVTFVPATDYTGTLTIAYTACGTDGETYDEALVIAVSDSGGGAVFYETEINTPVTLDSDDFSGAFEDETGEDLSYVRFTLPSASRGLLCYGYRSASDYTSKVTASAKYYADAYPQLSKVTFVPYADFTGTVAIAYTCYTSGGAAYTGELNITVSDPDADPFTDMGNYSWAEEAVAYLCRQGVVTGTGGGKFNPGSPITRGDFMLMLCRAFDLSVPASDNFTDVPEGAWYYDATATAKALGIAKGSGGRFFPMEDISREDAMVLVVRALDALGEPLSAGSVSDLAGFSDADGISDYALESVATLVKAGDVSGSGGLIQPKATITRAEMAVVLYRVLCRTSA